MVTKVLLFGRIARYTITGDSGPFSIHSTGSIVVSDPSELRKGAKTINFRVKATDGGGLAGEAPVEISIPVFNLYVPIFEQRFYYVTWEENRFNFRLPGLLVNGLLQVRAQDLDRPLSQITYHLTTPSTLFEMRSEGILILKAPLDWEQATEHHLQVRAFDGLHNSSFNAEIRIVVLNQNDNPPNFTELLYYVNVSEYYRSFSTPVTQVLAHDPDLERSSFQLSYSILEVSAPFRVDFVGNIYILTQLDYEQRTEYQFSVTVSDGFYPSQSPAQVIVNVLDENDHYPFFSQPVYQTSMAENSGPGTLNFPISATDSDASPQYGQISNYTILESHVPFEMRYNLLGRPYITNTKSLDYERDQHVYIFHVHAYDRGGLRSLFPAQVVVNILDSDDCPPKFSKPIYTASITENNPVPIFIVKVSATDCDVSPQYRRVEFSVRDSQSLVSIHPVSGTITGLRSFNFESSQPVHQFEIVARSSADISQYDTAVLNLTITDTNEFNPEFVGLPYRVRIPESTAVGENVITVYADDRDGGDLYGTITSYLIAQGDTTIESLPFQLNSSTGEISLTKPLDFDRGENVFEIPVVALDGGMLSARTTVEITVTNVEDEPPYFTEKEYQVTVEENTIEFHAPNLPENVFLHLKVSDGDLSTSQFTFNLSSYQNLFRIDSGGYVYLKQALDYETKSVYQLEVSVSDGVFISNETATIVVEVMNVNDQPPVFYKCFNACCSVGPSAAVVNMTVQVDENTLPHSPLLSPSACDFDGDELTYTVAGVDKRFFRMSHGDLYLSAVLDYEAQKSIYLNISATDSTFHSLNYIQLLVEVINIDDNVLEFGSTNYTATIEENSNPGSLNISISAIDFDDPQADVRYTIDDSVPFEIVQMDTGNYIITNTEAFDYEADQERALCSVFLPTPKTAV